MLKTVYEYAREYTGATDLRKGDVILDFLVEEGLQPQHRVLEVGCGCLAVGAPLIRYLDETSYVGLDPNGWLIVAALEEDLTLCAKIPDFVVAGDFMVSTDQTFDFVVAHSVLSHVADWQMSQALRNVRMSVDAGAVWLASLRLGPDSRATEWTYPDVTFFELETVANMADGAGWSVEHVPEYCERLSSVSPADTHDWIRLTAT